MKYTPDVTELNGGLIQEDIDKWKLEIDKLSQFAMCEIHRFAKSGVYPWLDNHNPILCAYWNERFKKLGGMTTEISKQLGW